MLLCIENDSNSADLWKFPLEFIETLHLKAFRVRVRACARYSINPKLKHNHSSSPIYSIIWKCIHEQFCSGLFIFLNIKSIIYLLW